MSITVGFIALFISVIIPGLLFHRFYYYGEFLKQFTTKQSITQSLLFAIIPGLFIQSIGILIYSFYNPNLILSQVFSIHQNLLSEQPYSATTVGFLNHSLTEYIVYSIFIFILAIGFGYISSRLIRVLKLDVKTRVFRFKNQWFYIFSGQIFSFNKFKKAVNVLNKPDLSSRNVDMVFADVLINSGGKTNLYTGFVVDYDLDSSDISGLERIYLFDAHRYKHTEEVEPVSGLKIIKVEKKSIPGSVFVLSTKELVNINLLYVTSEKKNVKTLENRRATIVIKVIAGILLTIAFGVSFLLFIEASWISSTIYKTYFLRTNWLDKTVAFLTYMQILGIFVPKKDESGELRYFSELPSKLLGAAVMIVIFVAMNFRWIFGL